MVGHKVSRVAHRSQTGRNWYHGVLNAPNYHLARSVENQAGNNGGQPDSHRPCTT